MFIQGDARCGGFRGSFEVVTAEERDSIAALLSRLHGTGSDPSQGLPAWQAAMGIVTESIAFCPI